MITEPIALLTLSDGITGLTAAQNSSEIKPNRVTGPSSLLETRIFGRYALGDTATAFQVRGWPRRR